MYGINWQLFIQERLPSPARKPVHIAWIDALLAPLKNLHTRFVLFRTITGRSVRITGQVKIMEYWLNELYDSSERRFEILDYTNTTPILIWGESYNNPIYLPIFLSSSEFDFLVIAPCQLKNKKVYIKAFLDRYKLAGKRYKLIFKNAGGSICSDAIPQGNFEIV